MESFIFSSLSGKCRTLVSHAEIGVWVQAPDRYERGSGGYTSRKTLRLHMQNPAIWCIFGVLKHFNNANAVPVRSGSFSAVGAAAFARTPLEMTPGFDICISLQD